VDVDVMAPIKAFDRFQQRNRVLRIPMAVVKKFGDDQGGNLAALVAYYAFFSLFPILLVFTTILGYVLQGDASARSKIVHSITDQIPVVGKFINPGHLTGSVTAIVIGVVTSLFAGLGVTNAAQQALDRVWAVPMKDRPDFIHSRLRGIGLLLSLGLLFVVATGVSGLVSGGLGGTGARIGGIAVSLLLNFALFLAAFRFMVDDDVPMRCLWVGVVVAGIFWEILQVAGGAYIGHVLKHSQNYGIFATVIALLVFLHLGAQLTLYAAEVNVVVARGLYPRSLLGGPQVEADKRTLTGLAKVEERHPTQEVDVAFHPEGGDDTGAQRGTPAAGDRELGVGRSAQPTAGRPTQKS
jgi:YihY family inner membrane protein